MKVTMNKLCMVFSRAFDIIETEQLGSSEYHSLRVALLCIAMSKKLGYSEEMISAIATCGMFHDSALTEYHLSLATAGEQQEQNMISHNIKGQENVSWLPFTVEIDKLVLYHHERGDGLGPFQKKEDEIPMQSAIIAAADAVDAAYHLQRIRAEELPALLHRIAAHAHQFSTEAAIRVLVEVFDEALLEDMEDEHIVASVERELPHWDIAMSDPRVLRIGEFMSRVIDYKSSFTHVHTSQIANRAWVMARHYGYSDEECNALFLAASLHDIGKIQTPTAILEKPGKLDDQEFEIIKQHVRFTLEWLGEVPEFEHIRDWAADHHEKLGGFGYSQGKGGDALDFNSRLMACIDIYQAVCEPRPYHSARTHEETMAILYDMSSKGQIDAQIVEDLDRVMAEYSMRSVPSPLDEAAFGPSGTHGKPETAVVSGYRCHICGYVYEGDSLPAVFICPVCRNDAKHFSRTERD